MIQIDMPMPEKCSDCIFCDDNCSCVASDYNGLGINVGCAYRTGRRDIRCPLKEMEEVVRCKDCAYAFFKEGLVQHGHIFCTKPYTERWQAVKPNNWFCADGVVKDNK